jgi:hypothetical protein
MKIIALSNAGCTSTDVNMGTAGVFTFVTKYNYTALCWELDIIDSQSSPLLSGLMLVPDVNLLSAYPAIGAYMGELYLTEMTTGQYQLPESLGATTLLNWYPASEIGGNVS